MNRAEDFSTPWVVYAPGQPFRATPESCTYRPDGAVTLVSNGGGQAGPTMQFGEQAAFVSSFAFAFPDEALAIDYIGVVNSDEWGTCRTGQLQQVQVDGGFENTVTLVTRDNASLNQGGLESYAEFDIAGPDGTVTHIVNISFYRLGRTVIAQNLEYGAVSDTDFEAITADAFTALSASYDRVNAL